MIAPHEWLVLHKQPILGCIDIGGQIIHMVISKHVEVGGGEYTRLKATLFTNFGIHRYWGANNTQGH